MNTTQNLLRTAVAAALGLVSAAALSSGPASTRGWEAKAVLHDVNGARVGTVKFEGSEHATTIRVAVEGITVGLNSFHGLHVHANDAGQACDPAAAGGPFTNVGGHWNPTGATHGAHAGDLPSLLVLNDGRATARNVTGRFTPEQLRGRAVILHAGPDNFANVPARYVTGAPPVPGPDEATRATGDSGGRIACGIVELH